MVGSPDILTPEQWHDAMDERFNGLEPSPMPAQGHRPTGGFDALALDDVHVYRISGNEQALIRSPRAVRHRASDLLKVCLVLQGSVTVEQAGRTVAAAPGEFMLYDTERPYRLTQRGTWQARVMTVRRRDLDLPDRRIERLLEQPHPAGAGVGSLYSSYLAGLVDADHTSTGPTSGTLTGGMVRHLRDAGISLLRAALTQQLHPVVESSADVVAEQLIGHITASLSDPGLSLESVARGQNLSTRTVQRLLAQQGLSFSTLVRERRLEGIGRDLADPGLRHVPIGALAARWGVHDQAWFSRAFRRTYGVTPTQFRRDHAPGDCP